MKEFFGSKKLLAKSMNLGDYNQHRGWIIPTDEDPLKEGYLVEYEGGYQSWSPKKEFEEAYREVSALTFGQAIEAAKKGFKIARSGWNGSAMFAYIVPANSYPAQTKVAKEHFGENAIVPYLAYWALKTAQEDIATWSPSSSDSLAEDWVIVY